MTHSISLNAHPQELTVENGTRIIFDMPEDAYRADPAIAQSDCAIIARSPAHLLARRRNPEKVTPAKLDGRALHTAILEPSSFMDRYVVLPEDAPRDLRQHRDAKTKSPSTVASIEFWDAWDADNAGRITMDAADYRLKQATAEAIRTHPELAGYFNAPGNSEVSIFTTDPVTGLRVKARIDRLAMLNNLRFALDPKSTEDAREEAFQRSALAYGYFRQAAFYLDVCEWAGIPLDAFLFIAFEKDDPFGIKVYEVSEDDIEYGRRIYRRALDTWAECVRNNDFPAYDTNISVLTRPRYAKEPE